MPKITWLNLNKTIEVPEGSTILDAAIENDIPLEHACGGCCSCTTCHVLVQDGADDLSEMQEDEHEVLDTNPQKTEISRLGCQTKVYGDITLEIPSQE